MISLNQLFKRQPGPMVGLDVSATSIKLVELGQSRQGQWVLERCAMEPLDAEWVTDGNITNFDEVVGAMRRLLKKSGSKAKEAALALPTSAVITKKVVLPDGLSEHELAIQVETEAAQYIPFSLDEVSLDFSVIGPSPRSPGDIDVLLAATRKERVQDRQALAESVGLKPVVMDVESYASRLAVHRLLQGPNASMHVGEADIVVLVKVGGRGYTLQIVRGDEVLYDSEQSVGGARLTQQIMKHYGYSIEEAEQKKRADELPPDYATNVLQPFVEGLAQDISRSLQFFFTSTPYGQVQHIMLFGGSAGLSGLPEAVQDHTGVSAKVLNPFEGMALGASVNKSRLRKEATSYLTACGLALRRFYQ